MKNVVFGASGALGSAIVRNLQMQKQEVSAVVRKQRSWEGVFDPTTPVAIADALNEKAVLQVTQNADVIYHCLNVPYSQWYEIMPIATHNILNAAKQASSRLVFPGNVYGYGEFIEQPVTENHPLAAKSKKGKLRNQLEDLLWEAHQKKEIKLIIPRFPDYLGPNVTNKLIAPIFQSVLKNKKAFWLGALDVKHSHIDIDDAAAACTLLANSDIGIGKVFHIAGFGALTGKELLELIFKIAGNVPKIGTYTTGFFKFMGMFMPEARELIEMMYEFEKPFILDDSNFKRVFPKFNFTTHEVSIKKTLAWFRLNSDKLVA